MATNWSFGQPFANMHGAPPQPAPQQQQHGHQQQPRSGAQGHPPGTYAPPPAPPAWNIPGLNYQAHASTAPQPYYPPSAAWPATPDQWNQMQMDMQQLPFMMLQQPGAMFTPPMPGLNYASSQPPQTPFHDATRANPYPAPPAQPAQHPLPVPNERLADVIDSDKEDGEVSEGEPMSISTDSYIGRGRIVLPEPPRSVPSKTTRAENKVLTAKQEVYNPEQPAAGQSFQSTSPSTTQVPRLSAADTISQAWDEGKEFVRTLHRGNVGYPALSAEGLDAGPLRDMYRSLNLPSEPEPVPPPPKANGIPPSGLSNGGSVTAHPAAPASNDSRSNTTVNTDVLPGQPVKSAPSPVDRKEYIARLQAAKKAKANAGTKTTPPQQTPPPASTTSKPAVAPEVPVAQWQNELLMQRIEAFKNGSSSPAASSSSKAPTTGSVPSAPLMASHGSVTNPSPSGSNPSRHQVISPSPFSSIPGLFIHSTPTVQPTQPPSAPGSSKRKRSLPASTADVPTHGTTGSAQAGAGPIKTTSIQIDIADDMSVDDARVDDPSAVGPRQNGLQNVGTNPMMIGLPSRPSSIHPSVSAASTPGIGTPSSAAGNPELLDSQRKEAMLKEIIQKKRREELEKQKRQAQLLADKADVPSQRTLESAMNVQAPLDQDPQQPGTAFPSSASDSQEVPREPKRRRKEIEAKASALEAEIADNAAKMARLTEEMRLLAANEERMRADKQRLIIELESLGIDTEGMPHAELQAKKNEIERKQEAELERRATSLDLPAAPRAVADNSGTVPEPVPEEPVGGVESATHRSIQPPNAGMSTSQAGIPGLKASFALPSVPHNATDVQAPLLNMAQDNLMHPDNLVQSKESRHLPSTIPVDSHRSATPVEDEEDFYSPEPATILPTYNQSQAVVDASISSEDGEVAMSESEDAYEPEEPQSYPQSQSVRDTEQDAVIVSSAASSLTSSAASSVNGGENPYEPPDVDQPLQEVQPSQPIAELEPSVLEEDAEEGEMDICTSSDESDDSDAAAEPVGEDSTNPNSTLSSKVPDHSVPDANDLQLELQPEGSAVASLPQTSDVKAEAVVAASTPRFTPYESPLKLFKSYRYHPNYAQDVTGGFLSLTFSHQIDKDKPLCPAEADGAACDDQQCTLQHFQDMNITGEKLLVQLGTANPGKTPAERQRWNDGLRSVLKDLRQKNTKDPDGIAMEIARYRRQFLQDDSRVVNL